MTDLPILHFHNPWHYGLLEKYHLHCFIAFCARSGNMSLDMCINWSFRKNSNILISKPRSAFSAPQFTTTTRLIWKLRNFAIRWTWQTKCVGGCIKFQNLGLLPLAYLGSFMQMHGLTLIPAWITNYMPGKVWGEITYPFLNFNGYTVEV